MKKVKFTTIDEYLETIPPEVALKLEKIRQLVHKILPDAEEVISYQMPAFRHHGIVIWFAAFKNHYSIFAPKVLKYLKVELKNYETSKSAIRIPMEKPVPVQIVTKIIKLTVRQNLDAKRVKELATKTRSRKSTKKNLTKKKNLFEFRSIASLL